ncbi:hypothetical protein [Methylorubrum extorquens]|nr:hypothetical protein [Methylorubrum extorquens]
MIFPDASLLDKDAEEFAVLRKLLKASRSRSPPRQPSWAGATSSSLSALHGLDPGQARKSGTETHFAGKLAYN